MCGMVLYPCEIKNRPNEIHSLTSSPCSVELGTSEIITLPTLSMLRSHQTQKMQESNQLSHSNHLSYSNLLRSGAWSSQSRNDVFMLERSNCVSPESSSSTSCKKQSIRSQMDSFTSLIHQDSDGFDTMTTTDVFKNYKSSSIAAFNDDSFDNRQFAIDNISESLTRSVGSAAHSAAVSPFKDELSAKRAKAENYSPAFKLSSVVTSPSNRMRIDGRFRMRLGEHNKVETITDETPRISNGVHQPAQDDMPNFSTIASPVAKQEDHTVNIDLSDWSLDMNFTSMPVESNDSKKSRNNQCNANREMEWVSFDPFDEFRTPHDAKFSFAPYIPEKNETTSSLSEICKVSYQLGELNARMASVECILLKLERLSQLCRGQNNYDDRSIAYFDDETDRMSDEKTCTPKKMHRNSCNESKSALFSRFFGSKKCKLYEL